MQKEFFLFLTGIVLMGAALGLLAFALTWAEADWRCSSYQKATGRPAKLVGLDCFVEVAPGDWHAYSELRQIAVK